MRWEVLRVPGFLGVVLEVLAEVLEVLGWSWRFWGAVLENLWVVMEVLGVLLRLLAPTPTVRT